MYDLDTFHLLTPRLCLAPLRDSHAAELFVEFDEVITYYMFPQPPERIDDTLLFIRRSRQNLANGSDAILAILDRETREFLGCVGVHDLISKTPELGVWLKKDAHGKGLGREAVIGIKTWLEQNYTYKYLLYPVDERNIASRRIPESLDAKLGRRYEKVSQNGRQLLLLEYHLYPPGRKRKTTSKK